MAKLVLMALLCLASPLAVADLAERLGDERRPAADRERDPGRKPAEVLAFLGVGEGMRVMDVIAAGGYYTEVLSLAVGKKGKVYAQNPPAVLKFRNGANAKALKARLAKRRLRNVVRMDKELSDVKVKAGSLDAAITALNFHDVFHRGGMSGAIGFSKAVLNLLKPGGVFGVVDHEGKPGQDNKKLHRMEVKDALEALLVAGFQIEETSDLLRNSDDDMETFVFDAGVRGKTSRFLIKAVKPLN